MNTEIATTPFIGTAHNEITTGFVDRVVGLLNRKGKTVTNYTVRASDTWNGNQEAVEFTFTEGSNKTTLGITVTVH